MKKYIFWVVILSSLNLLSMDGKLEFSSTSKFLESKSIVKQLKLSQNEWTNLVASCPLDIFLHTTIQNSSLLNDPIIKQRFLNIETKEKHKLTEKGLDYVIRHAEKLRHNFDYEVTFEWSTRHLGFGYFIKNTGIEAPQHKYMAVNTSGSGMTTKHLCDQLACVPYHKYGSMPSGSIEEWNAAIMTRANSYYREKNIPLRIATCEQKNGITHFIFQAARATPAKVYFQSKGGIEIAFEDTPLIKTNTGHIAESSAPSDSISDSNSSTDQLLYPSIDLPRFPLTIEATASSSSPSQDLGSLFIAESNKKMQEQRLEAEKRANEHAQTVYFSSSRAQIRSDVDSYLADQKKSVLPENIAYVAKLTAAIQRTKAQQNAELNETSATTELTGLRSQWEENVAQLSDERFIAHYQSSQEIRNYQEFKNKMKHIISLADNISIRRLIRKYLNNSTCIEFFDVILKRAYELDDEDFVESHLQAMHDRISGEPLFTLNPIQAIDEQDQPALQYYFEQMLNRKKALTVIASIINTIETGKKLSVKQQNNVLKILKNNYNDQVFAKALKKKVIIAIYTI